MAVSLTEAAGGYNAAAAEWDAVHTYPNKGNSGRTRRMSCEERLELSHDAGKVVI